MTSHDITDDDLESSLPPREDDTPHPLDAKTRSLLSSYTAPPITAEADARRVADRALAIVERRRRVRRWVVRLVVAAALAWAAIGLALLLGGCGR